MKKPHITRNSDRDDYATPDELFSRIDDCFDFDLDAAASVENTKCKRFNSDSEELHVWGGRVWCNPPFSKKEYFLGKALEYRNYAKVAVFLLPNNIRETECWRKYVWEQADQIISLTPRVDFLLDGKVKKGVGFSSCLVVYYPRIAGINYGASRETIWNWRA